MAQLKPELEINRRSANAAARGMFWCNILPEYVNSDEIGIPPYWVSY
jgi:hypothetical protein